MRKSAAKSVPLVVAAMVLLGPAAVPTALSVVGLLTWPLLDVADVPAEDTTLPPEAVEVVPEVDVVLPDGGVEVLSAGDVAVLLSAEAEFAVLAASVTADAALDAASAAEAAVAPAAADAAGSTGATETCDCGALPPPPPPQPVARMAAQMMALVRADSCIGERRACRYCIRRAR